MLTKQTVRRLTKLSAGDLLKLHSAVSAELYRRGISRSGNNPCADYAELLVAKNMRLRLVRNSTAGFDATDGRGRRFEIKARRQTSRSTPTMLSAIRAIEKQRFDFLIAVLFDENYGVQRAVRLPYETVRRLARFRQHVNGSVLMIRELWNAKGAEDLTAKLANGV
jgi:hypothetical protein